MPISLTCSGCDAALKVPDKLAGRKAKCPKCDSVLVIPGGADESEAQFVAAPPAKKAARSLAPAGARTKKTVPDDDEASADAAPRTKKAAQSSIATAPTRTKKTVPVPDDEDRANPDDDAEETPRKRKSKKQPPNNNKVFVIAGALCALLLFGGLAVGGGVGGYMWWRSSRSSSSTSASEDTKAPTPKIVAGPLAEESKYFPNNTQAVISVRFDQLRSSALFTDVKASLGTANYNKVEGLVSGGMGISMENVDRVVIAGPNEGENPTVVVVRTKKAAQASDIIAAVKKKDPQATFTEIKVAGKTINEQKPKTDFGITIQGTTFCIVDDTCVLVGSTTNLRTVLERGKAPEMSDKLQSAMKEVDFNKTIAGVGVDMDQKKQSNTTGVGGPDAPGPGVGPGGRPGPGGPGGRPGPGGPGGRPGPGGPGVRPGPQPQAEEGDPEMVVGSLNVDKDIVGNGIVTFKDAKTAELAKTKFDKEIADMKQTFKDVPSDVYEYTVKVNGNKVMIDFKVNGAALTKYVKTSLVPLLEGNVGPGPGAPPNQPPPGPGGPGGPGRPPRGGPGVQPPQQQPPQQQPPQPPQPPQRGPGQGPGGPQGPGAVPPRGPGGPQ